MISKIVTMCPDGTWKGAEFLKYTDAKLAFVSTSSICEGEQVQHVWSRVFAHGARIIFAHRPFAWRNNASNNAMVTCVVIGLGIETHSVLGVYDNDTLQRCSSVSPYLVPGESLFVTAAPVPISNDLSKIVSGSMPRDGGELILSDAEKSSLVSRHPESRSLIKPVLRNQ